MGRDRRQRIVNHGPVPMFIVAGLPPSLHNRADSVIGKFSSGEVKVVALPSAQRDGSLYPEKLVSSIARDIGGFALRRRANAPQDRPAPSSIMLLYVPAPDENRLLRRLDFTVFPVPLHELSARDARGQQFRHSFDAFEAAVAKAVGTAGTTKKNFDVVRERINRLADSEALLLPPRNFAVDDSRNVDDLFQGLIRGQLAWTDRLVELQLCPFTKETMSRLAPGETRRAFQDRRKLVFFVAHATAYHAPVRETEDQTDEKELMIRLKGLYRFGAALPNGFHHDVQYERGRDLGGVTLDCARMGAVQTNGPYVNISPNDVIRGDKRPKI